MPKLSTVAVIAGGLVVACIGWRFAQARRNATSAPLGLKWLFSAGTPDAVKDNRATLPVSNDSQWRKSGDALGANSPSQDEVKNAAQTSAGQAAGYGL